MDTSIIKEIKKDKQISKFSAYGFLKNLKFFEPYLLIYLIASGLNLLEIGILISIREAIIYIFEVPSGIIADYVGRKKELYMCFAFYIISFVFFFFTTSFMIAALAMVFFGLGEAFRSGTHKAMIYTYLENKDWSKFKTVVYGRTRSFSLIGSAISALLGIVIVLNVPSSRYIFLVSIIPYILDLLLIMSYPDSLDHTKKKSKASMFDEIRTHLKGIFTNEPLRRVLMGSASFEAIFRSIKDYIQPILELTIVGSGFLLISGLSTDENVKVVLGISYGLIYMISAVASRKAYMLEKIWSKTHSLNRLYFLMVVFLGGLYVGIKFNVIPLIVFIFLVLYVLRDLRKPIFVDVAGDYMSKDDRATVMSIHSQIKALITIIIAPIIGYTADMFGTSYVMLGLGLILLILYPLTKINTRSIS